MHVVIIIGGGFAGPTATTDLARTGRDVAVIAAGDIARPGHSVTLALNDGAAAGTGCHQSLVFPDFVQSLEIAA